MAAIESQEERSFCKYCTVIEMLISDESCRVKRLDNLAIIFPSLSYLVYILRFQHDYCILARMPVPVMD